MQLLIVTLFFIAYIIDAYHGAAADTAIKYPGPTVSDVDIDHVPEECRNLTYCTVKPKNYPQERFNWMFKNYKVVPWPALVLDVSFDNRQSDPSAENDCQSDVTFKPLYTIREKREDKWRVVVQAPDHDYVQRVRLETCKDPGASCFEPMSGNSDFITMCMQKVSTWKLLVAKGDHDSELVETDLPVCCSCYYKAV